MNTAIEGLMQQLLGAGTGPVPQSTQDQFHQFVQQAPPESLSHGLAAAFNANEMPPFGTMVAHMFGHANAEQKTGIVNHLLHGLGPSAAAVLAGLGLSRLAPQQTSAAPNLTTEQASALAPSQVEQIATQAKASNPGIVQTMSNFYAQHPMLVRTLGAVALSAILGNMRRR